MTLKQPEQEKTKTQSPPPSDERYSSIIEAENRLRKYLSKKDLSTVSRKQQALFIRQWCIKIGALLDDLNFRVTEAWCAGDLPLIIVSEFRLVDPRTGQLPEEKVREVQEQYAEFKMREITQRTFTYQRKNKGKGTWASFIELERINYFVKNYEVLEHFNVEVRESVFASIIFVAGSDGQNERLKREGTKARKKRAFPDKKDMYLIRSAYNLNMVDKVSTQLRLVTEKVDALEDELEQKNDEKHDRAVLYAAQLLHDGIMAGELKQKPPNRIVQLWNKYAVMIARYLAIIFIVFIIGSVIIAIATNTPIFSFLPDLSGGDGGIIPNDPGVITEP